MTSIPQTMICPDREKLSDFSLGKVTDDDLAAVASHVEACETCLAELTVVNASGDTLVALLRRRAEPSQFDNEAPLKHTLTRIREIGRDPSFSSITPGRKQPELGSIRDYRLLALLGEGGMGAVYKALHTQLEKIVALKVLPAERMQPDAVARFRREMRAVGKLHHPNIVQAFDAGEHEGKHFLVMECVDGVDLHTLVSQHGPLSIADACEIVRQTAEGLQHAHQHGLVHRDIKPSNLMLTRTGQIKVLDMGLALLQESTNQGDELTATCQIMGTPDYVAPEQAGDSHSVDIRADIYSLGCTLFKLVTGNVPYPPPEFKTAVQKMAAHMSRPFPDIATKRPDIPKTLKNILSRMVAKQPGDRYATPGDVATALAPLAAGHKLVALAKPAEESAKGDNAQTLATNPHFSALIDTIQPSKTLGGHRETAAKRPAGGPPARRSRMYWLAAAAAALIAAAVTIIKIQTRDGTLVLTVEGENAVVTIDGETAKVGLDADGRTHRISVDPGTHTLVVTTPDGIRYKTDNQFTMEAGKETRLTAKLEKTPEPAKTPVVAKSDPPNFALDLWAVDGQPFPFVELPTGLALDQPCTVEMTVYPRSILGPSESRGLWSAGRTLNLNQRGGIWQWIGLQSNIEGPQKHAFVRSKVAATPLLHTHLAAVSTGKELRLFVDGKLVGSSAAALLRINDSVHVLGKSTSAAKTPGWTAFDGTIDEVRISTIARYSENYTPLDRLEADNDTLALYHCDEGQGDVLVDSSGHNRHGKIVGAKWVRAESASNPPLIAKDGKSQKQDTSIVSPASASPDRAAAEWALGLGGTVSIRVDGKPEVAITKASDLPQGPFALTAVTLIQIKKVQDGDLHRLGGMPSLQRLDLTSTTISDAGLVHLKNLPALKMLSLNGTKVTDAGLAHIRPLKSLEELNLIFTAVTDAGMPQLKDLPNLQRLYLTWTAVTSVGLEHLKKSPALVQLALGDKLTDDDLERLSEWDQLSELAIISSQRITDAGAMKLARLKNLRNLALDGVPISDATLAAIEQIEGLGALTLRRTNVTGAGLKHVANLPKLQYLDVRETQIDDAGLAALEPAPALFGLQLEHTKVTDAGLTSLARMPSLRRVRLDETAITDAGVPNLAQLGKLTILSLQKSRISASGLATLRAALPKCQIDWSPADPDRAAADWVLGLGGTVSIRVEGKSEVAITKTSELPQGPFALTVASLRAIKSVQDDDLQRLNGLKSLRNLDLAYTRLTDAGLVHLKDLSSLQALNLEHVKISDAGLAHLEPLQSLRFLVLMGTAVTDAGVSRLQTLRLLETLVLRETAVTSLGVEPLRKSTPLLGVEFGSQLTDADLQRLSEWDRLKHLGIYGSRGVTDAGATKLARLKNLTSLTLYDVPISDATLEAIAQIKGLEGLYIGRTNVTSAGLRHVAPLAKLRDLHVYGTRIDDAGLAALETATALVDLQLNHTKVTDAGLTSLTRMPNLRLVWLDGTAITDAGVPRLAQLGTLTRLNLLNTRITATGLATLRSSLPNCQIVWSPADPDRAASIVPPAASAAAKSSEPASPTATDQDRIVAQWLLDRGGSASLLRGSTWVELSAGATLPEKSFVIRRVTAPKATSADIERFVGLKYLTHLNLSGSSAVDSAAVPHLSRLRTLTSLNIAGTKLNTSNLADLRGLPVLTSLAMSNAQLNDRWQFLHQLASLRVLTISGRSVRELERLEAFPQLRFVHLPDLATVDQNVFDPIQTANPYIRLISGYSEKTKTLGHDPGNEAARRLISKGVVVLGYAFSLPSGRNELTLQAVNSERPVTVASVTIPTGVKLSAEERQLLTCFDGSYDEFIAVGLREADAFASIVAGNGILWRLNLSESDLSDEGLAHLQQLVGLLSLDVRKTKVTPTAVADFRRALPQCKVEWSPANTDRAVAEWALSIGGSLYVSVNGRKVQIKKLDELPQQLFLLTDVNLTNSPVHDDDLARRLAGLSALEVLILDGTKVTDAGLKHVVELPKLKRLDVQATAITDAAFDSIAKIKNLKNLNVSQTKLTSASFRRFHELPNLEQLSLFSIPFGDADAASLVAAQPRLKSLHLASTLVTDAGLAEIGKLQSLEFLSIDATPITDAGLAHLARLPNLKNLTLTFIPITESGAKHLAQIQSLETLSLPLGFGDAALELLCPLEKIVSLNVRGDTITDACVPTLGKFKRLAQIGLTETRLTDAGIDQLASLQQYAHLTIRSRHISPAAIDRLRAAQPKAEIRWTPLQPDVSAVKLTPDRVVAEWALGIGGSVLLNVRGANVSGTNVMVQSVEKLPSQEFRTVDVYLTNCAVGDADLDRLVALPLLKGLNLDGTAVTDEGLKRLESASGLLRLYLSRTLITDAAFDSITRFKGLQNLHVSSTKITSASWSRLGELREIVQLGLEDLSVGDEDVARIIKDFPKLNYLRLNLTDVTDQGLKHLHEAKRLTRISLTKTKTTPAGIQALQAALPDCKIEASP